MLFFHINYIKGISGQANTLPENGEGEPPLTWVCKIMLSDPQTYPTCSQNFMRIGPAGSEDLKQFRNILMMTIAMFAVNDKLIVLVYASILYIREKKRFTCDNISVGTCICP